MKNKKFRIEKDSMGTIKVPASALYGAQTQRAIENFPISNISFYIEFINAILIIKRSAAITNYKLGLLDKDIKEAITSSIDKILKGSYDKHFPIDIFRQVQVHQQI